MKHDTPTSSKSTDRSKVPNGAVNDSSEKLVDSIENPTAANGTNDGAVTRNGVTAASLNDKNDSEADTEIESGKEDGVKTSSRRIKHEGTTSDDSPNDHHKTLDSTKLAKLDGHKTSTSDSVKDAEASNSSILTSAVSSPSNQQSSRAASENGVHSPSKTSVDSDFNSKNSKRKRENDESDLGNKRKVKREDSPTVSPTRHTSGTPPTRRRRTMSIQSASTPGQQGQLSRSRRKPPPIHTKTTQDPDSEDSSTSNVQSSHRKSASIQNARKMAPGLNTTRFRDRNGRTLLAKACFSDNVDVVRERYHENPDHLDIKEYAENSPLQIAALRGEADIVKFLVDQGANVNTQNVQKDTPLIDAVENGQVDVIRILLDAGANPSQPNAKGEEPLELIPEDDDDHDDIKKLLMNAKEKYKFRRPSEPTEQQPTSGKSRASVPLPSPKGSPSLAQGRQGLEGGRSRRAQRGQSKRDDLLWIPATAARLQQAAGEGDAQATNHILSMGIAADSESVLAAAKGCHEDCLSLLMAFSSNQIADPEPIPGFKTGWDTPLLATIGQSGENLNIIRILLGQPGFNPTRQVYENKTYHEIAKERAGPNAAEEIAILKEAYENYTKENGSPRKKKKQQPSSQTEASPRIARVENGQRKDAEPRLKSSDSKSRRRGSLDRPGSSNSRLQLNAKHRSRESSAAPSDRDRGHSPSKRDKRRRIPSSSEDDEDKVVLKQRKRLLTGKERREDVERKRRSSITSLDTPRSKLQEESKQLRASTSPARDRERNNLERKASDPASLQRLKRQRSEQRMDEKASNDKASEKAGLKKSATTIVNRQDTKIRERSDAEVNIKKKRLNEEKATKEQEQKRKEKEAQEKVEAERKAEVERKAEADRKADAERKAEADRKAAAERKAEAERKAAALAEEKKKREEEESRKRKEEEEELAARKKAEEEEKARKLEEKRRQEAEAEAAARIREMQRQKDQNRLPEALYKALHEHGNPPSHGDLRDWLQLRTITSKNLMENGMPIAQDGGEDTEWMLNMQIAVLLGLGDISLHSDERLAGCEHVFLPAELGAKCARWWTHTITPPQAVHETIEDYYARVKQNSRKFADLASAQELFFIKRQIFDDIASKASHLQDMHLQPGPFTFFRSPIGRSS